MLRKVSRRHHYGGSSEEAGEGTRGAPAAPEATEKVEHLMNELAKKKQVWDDVPSHQNFKWLAQMTPIEATEGSFENACRDLAKINRVFFLLLLVKQVLPGGRGGCIHHLQ